MEEINENGYQEAFFEGCNLLVCVKCGGGFEEVNYEKHLEECPFGVHNQLTSMTSEQNTMELPLEVPASENYDEFLRIMDNIGDPPSEIPSAPMLPQNEPKISKVASLHSEYTCPICQQKFAKADSLKRHVTFKHEKPSSFKCEFCEKTFSYKEAHKRHVTFIHLHPLQFTCDICEKKFSYLENLTRHVTLIHDNPSSFKCNLCDKSCNVKSVLDNHILRMHTNVRRFKCDSCNYSTMQKHSYLAHVKKCAQKNNKSVLETDAELSLELSRKDEIVCSVCKLACPDINSLLDHIKGHINGNEEHVPIATVQRAKKLKKNANFQAIGDGDEALKPKKQYEALKPKKQYEVLKPKKQYGKALVKKPRSKFADKHSDIQELNEKRRDSTDNKNSTEYSSSAVVNKDMESNNTFYEEKIVENSYLPNHVEGVYSNEKNNIAESALDMRAALAKALEILYQKLLVDEDLENYRCKLCGITCLSASAFKSHMKRHL